MAKLTKKKRDKLPEKDFAVKGRKYPVMDKGHAKAALSRVAHNGTSTEKAEVKKKVHAKFPGMKVSGMKNGKKKTHHKHVATKG
jgi:hypothetical protein